MRKMDKPNAKAIHICNSHRLSHRPKIAKEYVFPTHKETAVEKAHTPNILGIKAQLSPEKRQ